MKRALDHGVDVNLPLNYVRPPSLPLPLPLRFLPVAFLRKLALPRCASPPFPALSFLSSGLHLSLCFGYFLVPPPCPLLQAKQTALMIAVYNDGVEECSLLLDRNADPEAKDNVSALRGRVGRRRMRKGRRG